ncbi:hypothetical protein Dimus_031419 [Dionaea muscipula]
MASDDEITWLETIKLKRDDEDNIIASSPEQCSMNAKNEHEYSVTVGKDNNNNQCRYVRDAATKANNTGHGNGVLRYALHLRFLCPHHKKASKSSFRRCKSDPLLTPPAADNIIDAKGGERRFYLYNDLKVDDFVCKSDRVYTDEQILRMEKIILHHLGWELTVPTCYVFLVRFIKVHLLK